MKIACIGGGPGGLYFAILMKRAQPDADITVFERNRQGETFGFGVVFSDATIDNLTRADPPTRDRITDRFAHWDEIDIFIHGERWSSTGHGFAGLSRQALLTILQERAVELGIRIAFEHPVQSTRELEGYDLVVAADGVNSAVRTELADALQPQVDHRPNRFVWLGTTAEFPAFTFYFREDEAGLWRVHAYQYEQGQATFIVECTDETFQRSGLSVDDEDATVAYLEQLFAPELGAHKLIKNRSVWRQFPTVRCDRWSHGNVVLLGDAVHTAHFSIGSGTKLALEDAIALVDAIGECSSIPDALERYERSRRPAVDSLQRAAQVSLQWFEDTERYFHRLEPIQFAFSLLTRSLRVSHENLQLRDPAFVEKVDRWFAGQAPESPSTSGPQPRRVPPPMFTPFRLRDMVLDNRMVVSPMCQYSAQDGTVDDWHLVHLGSRAMGGAGLVMAEMTAVGSDGRISPGCAGLYAPHHVAAWRRITSFVHRHTPAKIGLQLGHAGRKGSTKRLWEGEDQPLDRDNWPLLGASPLPYGPDSQAPREMTREDMDATIADYVRATEMAIEADFDLIEIHMAHGYLLNTFLSPLTNRRSDAYGGTVANRMRFPLEVFAAVRNAWPSERPLSVRISATDWRAGGFDGAQAVELSRALKAAGCDIVDVSAGQVVPDQRPVYGRLFQTPFSDRVRLEADIPTITVGNISTYEDVNSILAAGRADLCALARAHLYDPYWTRHTATRQGWEMPWPDQYRSVARYQPRFFWEPEGER